MAGGPQPTRPEPCAQGGHYHEPMRRRAAVPGPTFAWAGDSRWRQLVAWVVRSAIIVVAALAVYLLLLYLGLPFLLGR